MPCFHPMLGQKFFRPDGKVKVRFLGSFYDLVDSEVGVFKMSDVLSRDDLVKVPCGQCVGCRLEYSRQWAIRCVLEAKLHPAKTCWFLTLTYDDEHLPFNSCAVDLSTGEVKYPTRSLVPSDLTKFMKDLRAYYDYHYSHNNIRFFGCGEYGDKNKRPHFHVIVFNLPIYDLVPYRFQRSNAFPMLESKILSSIWGKGILTVSEVTFDSCAYVARYIMKKHKGKDADEFYKSHGLVPEFTRMSRRPGIAREYYEKNKEQIYKFDSLCVSLKSGENYVPKPPAYFDRLFDVTDSERMQEIKAKRQIVSAENDKHIRKNTSLTMKEYMLVKEGNVLDKISNLTRPV